ncbi:MAG TPA: MogA/MoaB family molybdenum cofactor biosynthesis protein [Polyangia bacterium]
MSVEQHKGYAPAKSDLRVAVITASDSRTLDNDEGGALVQALAEEAGFRIAGRQVLREEPATIRAAVAALIESGNTDAVLLTGGTGLSGRDSTIEALAPLLEKTLPGFGELFRMLSFAEIGAAAMLSRAFAGSAGGIAVFAMPGSPAGVRLAMARLIIPELPHVVGQLRRGREPGPRPQGHHHHG